MTDLIIKMILEAIFASIASVGFAMVFNVPKHTLIYCAFGGAITYITRTIFLHLGLGIEISTFLASTFIGIIALYWSRKYLIPRPVYTVASIIPINVEAKKVEISIPSPKCKNKVLAIYVIAPPKAQ